MNEGVNPDSAGSHCLQYMLPAIDRCQIRLNMQDRPRRLPGYRIARRKSPDRTDHHVSLEGQLSADGFADPAKCPCHEYRFWSFCHVQQVLLFTSWVMIARSKHRRVRKLSKRGKVLCTMTGDDH